MPGGRNIVLAHMIRSQMTQVRHPGMDTSCLSLRMTRTYSNSLNDIIGKVNQFIVNIKFVFICIMFCYALSYFSFAFFLTPFLVSTRLMNVSLFYFIFSICWYECHVLFQGWFWVIFSFA